jgi:hypothetical protein
VGRAALVPYPGSPGQLGLHLPVRYRGISSSRPRAFARRPVVSVRVLLRTGTPRVLVPRTVTGAYAADARSPQTLYHEYLFSRTASAALRRAVAGRGAVLATTVVDRAARGVDTVRSSQPLRPPGSAAALAHAVVRGYRVGPFGGSSTNPCGSGEAPSNCVNAGGTSPFEAQKFWSKGDPSATCPSGTSPATYVDVDGITRPIWTIQTSAANWTTYWPDTEISGNTVYGGVIDWNIGGHPHAYTLWAACQTGS